MSSLFQRTLLVTKSAAQTLCGLILVRDYICEIAAAEGDSMLPTLRSKGDAILVDKFTLRLQDVQRGDVVVVTSPSNPHKLICKREQDFITNITPDGTILSTVQIPKGHMWIEGDNSARSHDSRAFGPVPLGLLHGKVVCKVWPFREFGKGL